VFFARVGNVCTNQVQIRETKGKKEEINFHFNFESRPKKRKSFFPQLFGALVVAIGKVTRRSCEKNGIKYSQTNAYAFC
jgi:hypothetical protein